MLTKRCCIFRLDGDTTSIQTINDEITGQELWGIVDQQLFSDILLEMSFESHLVNLKLMFPGC